MKFSVLALDYDGTIARDSKTHVTIDGHAKRGDFSRWIGEVFGDQPLAVTIGQVEEQFRLGHVPDLAKELVRPIRERYVGEAANAAPTGRTSR